MFLIILTLIAGFFQQTWWEDPKEISTCENFVYSWEKHPPIDYNLNPIGVVTVDNIDYNLTYLGNDLYGTGIPLNSEIINGGYIITKDGGYLGVIKETTVKCNKVFLPFQTR